MPTTRKKGLNGELPEESKHNTVDGVTAIGSGRLVEAMKSAQMVWKKDHRVEIERHLQKAEESRTTAYELITVEIKANEEQDKEDRLEQELQQLANEEMKDESNNSKS